jgi:hypothetical protein
MARGTGLDSLCDERCHDLDGGGLGRLGLRSMQGPQGHPIWLNSNQPHPGLACGLGARPATTLRPLEQSRHTGSVRQTGRLGLTAREPTPKCANGCSHGRAQEKWVAACPVQPLSFVGGVDGARTRDARCDSPSAHTKFTAAESTSPTGCHATRRQPATVYPPRLPLTLYKGKRASPL